MGATENLWNYIKGGGDDAAETPEILRRFVTAGADVNAESPDNGKNALQFAVFYDSEHMIGPLIDLGARHDVPSRDGWLPLHRGAWEGRTEACINLIARGANVNVPANDDKKYPVALAMSNGFGRTALELLALGADPHVTNGEHALSLAHLAVRCDEVEVFDTLKEKGVDLNGIDGRGLTPMHRAAKDGLTAQLVRLLVLGADPDIKVGAESEKIQGMDALDIARYFVHDETVTALRAWKAQQAAQQAIAEILLNTRSVSPS